VPYDRADIAQRDRWTCSLCGQRILRNAKVPHPRALTMDHVVPISEGGDDAPWNVKAAHFRCNSVKGNRPIEAGEQLMLALAG
jgi:5-methylcytosine-specific restriction endonuclease McrA